MIRSPVFEWFTKFIAKRESEEGDVSLDCHVLVDCARFDTIGPSLVLEIIMTDGSFIYASYHTF